METHIIYKMTSPSGKSYIGRTARKLSVRMNEHKKLMNDDKGYTLHTALRKYGFDGFVVEQIAETTDIDAAVLTEEALIQKHDSVRNGYNDTYGGGGESLWKNNPELLEKQRRTLSEMFSGYKNPMYGKSQTEETKSKMRKKAKGRFSLPWYQDRHGVDEGTELYQARCLALKNRKLKKDQFGRFKSN